MRHAIIMLSSRWNHTDNNLLSSSSASDAKMEDKGGIRTFVQETSAVEVFGKI